jgi:hypothetical protein
MSAVETLHAAHAAGITLTLDGDGILLEAGAEPPQAVLEALARHKLAILALLKPGTDGWCASDWAAYFDGRLRAASRDGCSRARAAALAFECCVVEWLNRHPVPSSAGRCAWCGEAESSNAMVLPFGCEPGGHTWLHSQCWPEWHRRRRAEAVTALQAIGLTTACSQGTPKADSETKHDVATNEVPF